MSKNCSVWLVACLILTLTPLLWSQQQTGTSASGRSDIGGVLLESVAGQVVAGRSTGILAIMVPYSYIPGDVDGNGVITISDAVYLISFIFAGGPEPTPQMAGDLDCSGLVTISDAVYLLNYVFANGPPPHYCG